MYNDDYKFPDFIYTASFWAGNIKGANDVIIDSDKIKSFNAQIKSKVYPLNTFIINQETVSGETLKEYIKSYKIPEKGIYDSTGQLVDNEFYKDIINNTNLGGIKDSNPVRYGISTRKISIRCFPTESAVYSCTEHSSIGNFDRFQETGCNACELLLILHESLDKKWYFVKMYNYFGWAKVDDIAISEDKKQISDFINNDDFLIVTGKEINLVIDCESCIETIKCGMSTKLHLSEDIDSLSNSKYTIKYPVRSSSGELIFKKAYISKNEDVVKGYLPYTRYNIINQAFKYLNSPYDWGEKFSGKDCSGFVMTIFRCFGFMLPRNASQQEQSYYDDKNHIIFNVEDTEEVRYSKMEKFKAGTAIFMDGHVIMYVGKYNGMHYMVHTFSGYGFKKGASYESRTALCTAISPVNLPTSDGTPFIRKFTSAVFYE